MQVDWRRYESFQLEVANFMLQAIDRHGLTCAQPKISLEFPDHRPHLDLNSHLQVLTGALRLSA
jgi:hypothetical protein